MNLRRLFGAAVLALAGIVAMRAEAEPRVALVIGNAHYGSELGTLESSADDARLMADALKQVGFQVIVVEDADQKQMKRAIVAFGEKLSEAGPQATGLFFFSGHGLSAKGRSFLIPLDAKIAREADLSIESLTVDDIFQQMMFVANATNLVIVNWSYTSPLSKIIRSVSEPAQADLTWPGLLIAYSGIPGQAPFRGRPSPYVTALAEAIKAPGLSIHEVFDGVRKQVLAKTEGSQVPWEAASMTDPFYFTPKN